MKAKEIFTNNLLPLLEGGVVFKDTSPIAAHDVKSAYELAIKLLPTGIIPYQTGSTYSMMPDNINGNNTRNKESGDMDIMIDKAELAKKLKIPELGEKRQDLLLKQAFQQYIKDNSTKLGLGNIETKIYGINVGVALPINNKKVQVDFELVNDPENIHVFHRHAYNLDNFKGVHKQRLLASIARSTITQKYPYGLAWSAFEGLKNRGKDPKKPNSTIATDIITNNINDVAKILLGQNSNSADLGNVSTILKALARNNTEEDFEKKIADARKEFVKDGNSSKLPSYNDVRS